MNKTLVALLIIAIVAIIGGGAYFATRQNSKLGQPEITSSPTPESRVETKEATKAAFKPQTRDNIKTPHFVSSTPANNQVLTQAPSQVTINFNFNLGEGSKISVTADGNEVTTPQGTKISADKLSMTALINPVESANYKVNYTACWPDGSCHNGSLGFTVKL